VTVSGTVSGAAYELQSRSNAATGGWNSLPGSVSASSSTTQLTATNAFGQPVQFYRVHLLP
jgi:hypothetical protein